MADALTLKRLARRLEQAGGSTPQGVSYWPTLAEVAATELEKAPVVTQAALPAQPFIALIQRGGGFVVIARGASLADLTTPVTDYLQEHGVGAGEVLACEVKRVLAVAP